MRNEINEAHEAVEDFSDDNAKKRKVVIPGEVIIKGEDYLPGEGARRDGENVVASRFGLAEEAGRVIKVIAITGAFIPRRNNVVLGRVTNITFNGWVVDIDSASSGFLPIDESPRFINKNEMDQFLAIGDVVAAKIWSKFSRKKEQTWKMDVYFGVAGNDLRRGHIVFSGAVFVDDCIKSGEIYYLRDIEGKVHINKHEDGSKIL